MEIQGAYVPDVVEETGSDNPHSTNATVTDRFPKEKFFDSVSACLRVIGYRNVLWLRNNPAIYVVRRQSVVMTNPKMVLWSSSLQPGQHNRSRLYIVLPNGQSPPTSCDGRTLCCSSYLRRRRRPCSGEAGRLPCLS